MKRNILTLTFLIVLATAIANAQAPTNSQPSQQNVPGQTSQSETQNSSAGSVPGNASPANNSSGTQAPATPGKPTQAAPRTPAPTTPTVDQNPTSQQAPNAYSGMTTNEMTDSATLKGQLESAFQAEPTLTGANIQVTVTDSTIDLSGTVPNGKEKVTAKRIAQSYAGNRKVADHMTIIGHSNPAPNANPNPN